MQPSLSDHSKKRALGTRVRCTCTVCMYMHVYIQEWYIGRLLCLIPKFYSHPRWTGSGPGGIRYPVRQCTAPAGGPAPTGGKEVMQLLAQVGIYFVVVVSAVLETKLCIYLCKANISWQLSKINAMHIYAQSENYYFLWWWSTCVQQIDCNVCCLRI